MEQGTQKNFGSKNSSKCKENTNSLHENTFLCNAKKYNRVQKKSKIHQNTKTFAFVQKNFKNTIKMQKHSIHTKLMQRKYISLQKNTTACKRTSKMHFFCTPLHEFCLFLHSVVRDLYFLHSFVRNVQFLHSVV